MLNKNQLLVTVVSVNANSYSATNEC